MSEQISFTIPVTPSALNRTITMLKGMADDLQSTSNLFDAAYHDAMGGCYPSSTPQVAVEDVVIATPPAAFVAPIVTPTTGAVASLNEPVEDDDDGIAGTGVGLDSRGFPWDERIHASTMSTVANGTWKRKRGVDEALVAMVEAEHLGNAAGQSPISETTVEPKVEATIETAPPPPPPVAAETPPPPPPVTDYRSLVSAITANGIPLPKVLEVCSNHGIASLPLLQANVDMIPFIAAELGL